MKRILGLLIVIIIFFGLCACDNKSDYIIRKVEWNMSTEQVIKSEKKLSDTGEGYQYKSNIYSYLDAVMFKLPCSIIYEFNDNDELKKVGFQFDATSENFELINSVLNEDYGEPLFEESDDMATVYKWEAENTLISLVFMDYESEYFSDHLLSVLYNYNE